MFKTIHHNEWDRVELESLLERLRGKKITVIGDVGIDRYTVGDVERISPEAPVPIVRVTGQKLKLGVAANVADNIQALGAVPHMVGIIGDDHFANDLRRLCAQEGISDRYLIVDPARPTVLKERIVSDGQQLLRVDYETEQAILPAMESAFCDVAALAIADSDATIVEDYAKGLLTPLVAEFVFSECKKLKKLSLIDPNAKTPLKLYQGADVLTPNRKETEMLLGVKISDERDLHDAGRRLLEGTGASDVVITLGKDGMALFSRGDANSYRIPTYAREVFDVSGAGDTVIAVLALVRAAGGSMINAAILSNLAAGVEVSKRGTATVTPEEIRRELEYYLVGGGTGAA